MDYLGWCTWDSFYTDLTIDKVITGLKSFMTTGVTPRFIILDDGWQGTTVNDRVNGHQWRGRLVSFKANFKFDLQYNGTMACVDNKIEANECVITPDVLPGAVGRDTNSNEHSLDYLIKLAKQDLHIKKFFIWHTLTGELLAVFLPAVCRSLYESR